MRLTKAMLEAIMYMGSTIEAQGSDDLQGCMGDEKEEARLFGECMKAMDWAGQKLNQREAKAKKKREP